MANLILQYLEWHFIDVPKAILIGWKNFLVFNIRYFSIPLLFKTFFSYWRRFRGSYGRGFDLKVYFEAFSFNIISRLIGAVMRTALISMGLTVEVVIFLAGLIVLIGWMILPFVSAMLFFMGLAFML